MCINDYLAEPEVGKIQRVYCVSGDIEVVVDDLDGSSVYRISHGISSYWRNRFKQQPSLFDGIRVMFRPKTSVSASFFIGFLHEF